MITGLILQIVECLQLLPTAGEAKGPQRAAKSAQHPQDLALRGFSH